MTVAPAGYSLLARIGEGAFGHVYRAMQVSLGRQVALKLQKSVAEPGAFQRFQREATVLARLDHPHILKAFDFGVNAHGGFLATELLRGSLKDRIDRNGPLEAGRAARLVAQVLDALSFAHARGVIHRDVKPGNILMAEDGDARLGDFGLAFLADATALSTEFQPIGTPHYMAPEALLGNSHSASMDVYGAAVLLYELVVGRPPTAGIAMDRLLEVKLAGPVIRDAKLESYVPAPLRPVLAKALEPNETHRFATAADFSHALKEATRPRTTRRIQVTGRMASFAPRKRRTGPVRLLRRFATWCLKALLGRAPSARGTPRTGTHG